MANKVISYTQVPVEQKDLRVFHIEALNDDATAFRALVTYNIRDSEGNVRGTAEFSQDGPGVLAAPAIASLLAAMNAAQGT